MNNSRILLAQSKLPRSVLMVSDNFWVGGRETFLRDIVDLMREIGVDNISLMAKQVDSSIADNIFDTVAITGNNDNLNSWRTFGDTVVKEISPQLIWAHHYSIGPALLLAKMHKLPLHITLHGPLMSAGQYNYNDALAFSVATSSGATVSAVSQEIMQELDEYNNQINFWGIFPNKVQCPETSSKSTKNTTKLIKFSVFSRQSKLEHLRQSILLACKFKKQGHPIRIDIYTGITEKQGIANKGLSKYQQISRLFGRKWLMKNTCLINILRHTYIHPLTNNVTEAIQKSDVVLGMGRVALEAIANSKTAILIGYHHSIGVIDINNFKQYQTTNFSGRAQLSESPRKIIKDTLEGLNNSPYKFKKLAALVDIKSNKSSLTSLLINASNTPAIGMENEKIYQLLTDDIDTLNANNLSDLLSDNENILFNALTNLKKPV